MGNRRIRVCPVQSNGREAPGILVYSIDSRKTVYEYNLTFVVRCVPSEAHQPVNLFRIWSIAAGLSLGTCKTSRYMRNGGVEMNKSTR